MDNYGRVSSNGKCCTTSNQIRYQDFLGHCEPRKRSATSSSSCETFEGLSVSPPIISQLQKGTLAATSTHSVFVSSSNQNYSTTVPTATFNLASGLLNSSSNNHFSGFKTTYADLNTTAVNAVQQPNSPVIRPLVYSNPGHDSNDKYSLTSVPSSNISTGLSAGQLPTTNICSTGTPLQPYQLPVYPQKPFSSQAVLLAYSTPQSVSNTTSVCNPSCLPLFNSVVSSQAPVQCSSYSNLFSVNSQVRTSLSSTLINPNATVNSSSPAIPVQHSDFPAVQPYVNSQSGQASYNQYYSTLASSSNITSGLPAGQLSDSINICSTSTPSTILQPNYLPDYAPGQGVFTSYCTPQPVSNTTIVCTSSCLPVANSVLNTQPQLQTSASLNHSPVYCQVQASLSATSLNSCSTGNFVGGETNNFGPTNYPPTQTGIPVQQVPSSCSADLSKEKDFQGGLSNSTSARDKLSSVCSQDVVFVGEVQKPELSDKSTDVIFVRKNYNRSGVVCLTPNKKLRKQKSLPHTNRISSGDSTTEVNITISQTNSSSNETVLPISVWSYQTSSGLETFDPKTTSLLEHLYLFGSDSSIILTLPGKPDKYKVNIQTLTMTNNRNGEELLLHRTPSELCQDVGNDLLPSSGMSEFPSHWLPQDNDIELVRISSTFNNDEWITIENLMRKTLPGLCINRIERVQNKKLWIRYAFQKAMLIDKNGLETDVNEKLLFHGTRSNPPCKIWQSEDGFDMRYCNSGVWGLGTYFAEEAAYSHNYAHVPLPYSSLRQMFVASVLTGHSKEMVADRSLRRPPVRIPATATDPEVLYDSVTGVICGKVTTRIYVLYKFDMAYPSYLVTYSA